MNKRYYQNDSTLISRLADKAHEKSFEIYKERTATERADEVIFYDIFNQEFARLIVSECAYSVVRNEAQNILERFDIDPKTFFGDKS
jgi:hypothetical protein